MESDRFEAEFKTTVFASNPALFQELYSESKEEEYDIQEFVPEGEHDLQKMLMQLKREGVIT